MLSHNQIIIFSFLGGTLPALLWLWFWLREDKESPEPNSILTVCFILGMLSVVFIIPIQKFIQIHTNSGQIQTILWASVEEMIKYFAVVLLLYKSKYINKPIDWPMFIITTALGFAALENTLFLINPISAGQTTVGLLTGNLRFLGSTLLHAVSSGIIGITAGLSFYLGIGKKIIYLLIGFISAIALHSVFNFFIMSTSGSGLLQVFALLWVATIINLLLFEKLRRMSLN